MTVNLQFANLEPDVQNKFYAVAAKDPNNGSAVEWFEHLVPEPLRDSSAETEVYMDGGTVTQEVYVYDRGRAGGQWEIIEHEIPDRDISRLVAGANGGEYTHDNTIMEKSSINRSRGGVDMTAAELEAAETANTVDTTIIDDTTSANNIAELGGVTAGGLTTAASETIADFVAPVIGSVLVGKIVADRFEEPKDKIGWGALASGLGALACATPPGQFALGCYGVYSIGKLTVKAAIYTAQHI